MNNEELREWIRHQVYSDVSNRLYKEGSSSVLQTMDHCVFQYTQGRSNWAIINKLDIPMRNSMVGIHNSVLSSHHSKKLDKS